MPAAHSAAPITGPVAAVVTPFTDDQVDEDALGHYVAWLWERGVKTILVNGTTGEFFATTPQERRAILARCRRDFPGTVIAHVGAGAAAEVIAQLEHAQPLADYLALITPHFFANPPADGVLAYFRQILPHAERPVVLYNFPRHTQTPITPAALAALAQQFPRVVAIKDSAKDRDVTRAFAKTGLQVLLGDDGAATSLAELGCRAIVTGGGTPLAEAPVAIARTLGSGRPAEAARLQQIFGRWRETRHQSGLPEAAFAKAALGERIPGFPTDVRPPLVSASPAEAARIRHQLRALLTLIAPLNGTGTSPRAD